MVDLAISFLFWLHDLPN